MKVVLIIFGIALAAVAVVGFVFSLGASFMRRAGVGLTKNKKSDEVGVYRGR